MKRLLLVEDDPIISKTLTLSLHYRGFEIISCDTTKEAQSLFDKEKFDGLILDVNLSDGNGFDLCKIFRAQNPLIPILMLTARGDENSAVRGIESGADDYVRKPFGLEELTARLNRFFNRKKNETDFYNFATLKISLKQRIAWVEENPVALGKREFDILAMLVKRGGEVVTREEILNGLEDSSEVFDRTIDSHLSHLRKKLKEAHLTQVQITPIYGVGYRLEKK